MNVNGISPTIRVIKIGRHWRKADYVVVQDPDGHKITMYVGDELALNVKLELTDVRWGDKSIPR